MLSNVKLTLPFLHKDNLEYSVSRNFSCLFADDYLILQSRIT